MPITSRTARKQPQPIGIAEDHCGFELEQYLAGMLRKAGPHAIDFGGRQHTPDTVYPNFVGKDGEELREIRDLKWRAAKTKHPT